MNRKILVVSVLVVGAILGWMLTQSKSNTDISKQELPVAPNQAKSSPKAPSRYPKAPAQNKESSSLLMDMEPVVGNVQVVDEADPVATQGHPGYEIEDGVAVIEKDIVLGEIISGTKYKGMANTGGQRLVRWKNGIVPFHINGDVPDPELVMKAIAMFADTGVSFIPYTDQNDVLVFQAGTNNCKSYLGKVGGNQPIWIAPGCGPKEIAHEVMHALGFIHEQNRADRDQFVEVLWDNIEPSAKINFEAFPTNFMKVSGLGRFDYESLMIYKSTAFANGPNKETLQSKIEQQSISPGETFSSGDLHRLKLLKDLE